MFTIALKYGRTASKNRKNSAKADSHGKKQRLCAGKKGVVLEKIRIKREKMLLNHIEQRKEKLLQPNVPENVPRGTFLKDVDGKSFIFPGK